MGSHDSTWRRCTCSRPTSKPPASTATSSSTATARTAPRVPRPGIPAATLSATRCSNSLGSTLQDAWTGLPVDRGARFPCCCRKATVYGRTVRLAGSAESPCRLFVYLAGDAPIGVVLRRGPSAWVRLSLWHTDTDEFEHGQWMRCRVYERRCDLSADGSLFASFTFGV